MSVAAVQVEDLWVSYGNTCAVRGISFEIPKGEVFGFIGPNGAGKSTTIKVLATLLRQFRGWALVNGISVARNPQAVRERVDGCRPEDLAILIYTSGTTGKPKGAMHSHHGLVYTMRGYNTLVAQDERDERMCFLPLCHVAERMGGEYFAMYTGSVLNFVENPETVPENVREIAPTVFTAVPRVWEKFYSGVMIALKESTRLQQAAYAWSIGGSRRSLRLLKLFWCVSQPPEVTVTNWTPASTSRRASRHD